MADRVATGLSPNVYRCVREAARALDEAGVRDEPVLVGVSGGGDSMALLEVAGLLAPKLGLELHVACVDHALRPEAPDEVAFVREAAARWSAGFREFRLEPSRGDEDTLRRARHAALERARIAAGCRVVLLGHTRDDQVETIVFRFLRGAGLGGLAGIAPVRTIDGTPPGVLVRPLLGLARADLRRLLEARGLAWIEDPTNESPRYARGRLRSSVLPAVEAAFGAGALDHLLDVAPRWRDDEDFLEQQAARHLAAASRSGNGSVALDAATLAEAHPAMRARVLRRWLSEATGRGPTSREIAAIERWLASSGARRGSLDLPAARIEGSGGRIVLRAIASEGEQGTTDPTGSPAANDGGETAPRDVGSGADAVPCRPKGVLPPSEARVRVPRTRAFSQDIPRRCRDSAGPSRRHARRGGQGLKPNE